VKKIKAVTGHQSRPLREVSLHVTLVVLGWSTEDSFRERGICTFDKDV
jgi:hypothetical protein